MMKTGCRFAKAKVTAESDDVTTVVKEKCHTYLIDEPKQLGGKGQAASPLGHFLGALIGCTQITLHTIAEEQQVKVPSKTFKALETSTAQSTGRLYPRLRK